MVSVFAESCEPDRSCRALGLAAGSPAPSDQLHGTGVAKGRIRTCDLWLMGPASYHCSTPQYFDTNGESRTPIPLVTYRGQPLRRMTFLFYSRKFDQSFRSALVYQIPSHMVFIGSGSGSRIPYLEVMSL